MPKEKLKGYLQCGSHRSSPVRHVLNYRQRFLSTGQTGKNNHLGRCRRYCHARSQKTLAGKYFVGRKLKLQTHLGVYFLQKMYDKIDRQMKWELRDNAAYQLFCGAGIVKNFHVTDHNGDIWMNCGLSDQINLQNRLKNNLYSTLNNKSRVVYLGDHYSE